MSRDKPEGDPCSCRDRTHERVPCPNLTFGRGWVKCRPCALSNHGGPCNTGFRTFVGSTCSLCGYTRGEHATSKA